MGDLERITDVDPLVLTIDLRPIYAAMRLVAEHAQAAVRSVHRFFAQIMERANDPVRVAGLEAKYYVRGGLDPAHATRDQVRVAVTHMLAATGPYGPNRVESTGLLRPANRRRLAAALIRGQRTFHHRTGAGESQ